MSARVRALALVLVAVALGSTFLLLRRGRGAQPSEERPATTLESAPVAVADPVVPTVTREPAAREDASALTQRGRKKNKKKETASETAAGQALLRIEVVELETGRPIQGVSLQASGTPAQTDANGRAELAVPAGRPLALRAYAWSGAAESKALTIEALTEREERTLRVPLRSACDQDCFVRVLDGETGLPVPGAEVEALVIVHVRSGPEMHSALSEATLQAFLHGRTLDDLPRIARGATDEDGRVALRLPGWAVCVVRSSAPGTFWSAFAPAGKRSSSGEPVVVELRRSATLETLVLEDGRPAPGVELRLHVERGDLVRQEDFHGPPLGRNATTAADGRAVFEGLPAETPIEVELWRGDRVLRRLLGDERAVLRPGEKRALELTLGPGCRLTGVALDDGDHALAGLELVLAEGLRGEEGRWQGFEALERDARRFAACTTDADGRFSFEGVPPGDWALAPCGDAHELPAAALSFHIGPEQTARVIELSFERLTIRGQVLDPFGQPLARAEVSGQARSASGFWPHTRTRADGTFELGPLLGGSYFVTASSRESFYAPATSAHVSAGSEGLVLQLARGGVLHGSVANLGDEPRAADISAWRDGDREATWEGDRFNFPGLEPGRYDLVATTRDGEIGVLQGLVVHPGVRSEPLVLRVAPGCRALFRLAREHESAGFSVTWNGAPVAVGRLEPGEEESWALPAGEVVVSWRRGAAEVPLDKERRVLVVGETVVFER